MEIFVLYSTCVLIWGSTWFAITYQLGHVAPEVSVCIRFFLAALITFSTCILTRTKLKFAFKDHLWFALQGVFMFCLNYIFTYFSEGLISSGLVAVTFTLMVYFNIVGMRVFYGQKIERRVVAGAVLGGAGVFCLFFNEISSFRTDPGTLRGLALGAIASVFASLGNMVSVKGHKRKYPVMASNAWGMLYGSCLTLVICLCLGRDLHIPWQPSYLLSLLYLAFFGSFVAFGAYVSLIGKVGPERAAYCGILTPIIALIISTFFENFHWHGITFIGVALSLSGNVLVLNKKLLR